MDAARVTDDREGQSCAIKEFLKYKHHPFDRRRNSLQIRAHIGQPVRRHTGVPRQRPVRQGCAGPDGTVDGLLRPRLAHWARVNAVRAE